MAGPKQQPLPREIAVVRRGRLIIGVAGTVLGAFFLFGLIAARHKLSVSDAIGFGWFIAGGVGAAASLARWDTRLGRRLTWVAPACAAAGLLWVGVAVRPGS